MCNIIVILGINYVFCPFACTRLLRQAAAPAKTKRVEDFDDSDVSFDSSDSSSSDEDDDDQEELLRELRKIKKERAAEKKQQVGNSCLINRLFVSCLPFM